MNLIDDYRINKGWAWSGVHDAIFAEPLYEFTEEEWTNTMDRFTYLDTQSKRKVMNDYNSLLAGDTWGEEYR